MVGARARRCGASPRRARPSHPRRLEDPERARGRSRPGGPTGPAPGGPRAARRGVPFAV